MVNYKNNRQILIVIMLFFVCIFASCKRERIVETVEEESADYHIGIVTGTTSQAGDENKAAEEILYEYKDAALDGIISHLNYPDDFVNDKDGVISQITSFIKDSKIKAIIVNQAVPGTAEAFKKVKLDRPDIILLAANSQDSASELSKYADLIIDPDSLSRGYLIPLAAKKMGAKTFVHISFARHLEIEAIAKRKDIMKATCKKIGLQFISIEAPDPIGEGGIAKAQNYILENVSKWIKKYGRDTAFFTTNEAHNEPLIKKVAELGGIFVEQDLPGPNVGYPKALNIEITKNMTYENLLKEIENVLKKKNIGRMGTWVYPFGNVSTKFLLNYAMNKIEGDSKELNLENSRKALEKITPKANWVVSNYIDENGKTNLNHILVYQDTYVFGKGCLKLCNTKIPDLKKLVEEYGDLTIGKEWEIRD